jgi:8-oxo-dGTP pyrophosphatase MutT (NUDIX family)
VAERCGYRLEGTLRRSGPPIPGATTPADCQVFGLLPEEYRALDWAAAAPAVPVAAPIADFRVRIRASAVILDADGRVLLVRQFRDSDLWLPPGGGVEPGELCQEAVVREVREETGLAVACGRLLWMRDAVHHHGTDKVRQRLDVCFWADVLRREPGPAEHEWGYFARDRMPSDNVLLPPDFWSAVDGGFRDHDPGAGATHHRLA